MYLNKKDMLTKLHQQVSENITKAKQLLDEPVALLSQQPTKLSWSVLQVIEHLNTYNIFYLPRLHEAITNSSPATNSLYKTGWLGDYFVKMMQPKDGQQKKFKAIKRHTPAATLGVEVIQNYISSQQHFLDLIDRSAKIKLETPRVPTSLSPLITMRIGDVYRFLVAHQQRHHLQINNTLRSLYVTNVQLA